MTVVLRSQSYHSVPIFSVIVFVCVCTSLRSITYPGGDAIRFLSQDIEMPLNQNKSFTPGGKKGKPQTLGVVQCPLMAVIAGL